jgi:hypothetical protein
MMKVEFFAGSHPGAQTLAEFTAVTPVAGRPAWTRQIEDGEGGTFKASSRGLIVQGETYWYMLNVYCIPEWSFDCEQIFTHIVGSFTVTR